MAGTTPEDGPDNMDRHQPLIHALQLVADKVDQARDSIEDVEFVHEALTDPSPSDEKRAFEAMGRIRGELEETTSAMAKLATVVAAYAPILEDLEMRLEAALARDH